MNKLEVACFSGHRRLPRDCAELKRRLKSAVTDLIERGVVFFGAGGALGFGMIAEETVLRIRTNKLDTPPKIRYNKEMIEENKRKAYESDLTDSQWEIIEPLMWKSGNKSKWEKRELINAVLYLVDSGCKWRQLPHDFPPHTTVSNFYYKAVREGLWEKILKVTVIKTREEAGRSPEPSYALIDSQSVKTVYSSDERGYDGGKNKRTKTTYSNRYYGKFACRSCSCRKYT